MQQIRPGQADLLLLPVMPPVIARIVIKPHRMWKSAIVSASGHEAGGRMSVFASARNCSPLGRAPAIEDL
jgi:hypothetical protein